MKRKCLLAFVFCMFYLGVFAEVRLPDIIGDNMVLQQKAEVSLWGRSRPETLVKIRVSWSAGEFASKSNAAGEWKIKIRTPSASYKPQSISFNDGKILRISNVLIGEVWFCSGQSNMEMPLGGFANCPVKGANDELAKAGRYRGIRCAVISHISALNPQKEVPGKWMTSKAENAVKFSAAAFYFANFINRALDVPVGIIDCSWGGSTVEGWLPESVLKEYPDIDLGKARNHEAPEYMEPMIMYNGMLKPLENYTVRGFLWYQGESNVGKPASYAQRLATMVALWRREWGLGELPFYYVEIAPFEYGPGEGGAYLREAQYKAQSLIPNSGMISTNDLVQPYEAHNIHPCDKKSVGKRLAYMALKNVYGFSSLFDRGPEYRSMEIKDHKIIVNFSNVPDGFARQDGLEGFEIAGEDKVFHPARAKVCGLSQIELSADGIMEPVAVRYCFHNFSIGNVRNSRGLPLVPFRSDKW